MASLIDCTDSKPGYMKDTISNALKRRIKVPISPRSGFHNITQRNTTIPLIPSALPGRKDPKYNHIKSRCKLGSSLIGNKRRESTTDKENTFPSAACDNASMVEDSIQSDKNKIKARIEAKKIEALKIIAIQQHQEEKNHPNNSELIFNAKDRKLDSSISNLSSSVSTSMIYYTLDSSVSFLVPIGNQSAFLEQYDEYDDELGKGESTSVVEGGRLLDGVQVAIKKIKKSEIYDWAVLNDEKIPFELYIMNKVSGNDGVIRLFGAFDMGDEYYFVMESLKDDCSLADMIGEPMEESIAKSIFRDLVKAVDRCHQAGVYHRDIKEPNILLDKSKNNKPILIDFGLSLLVENSPYRNASGTLGYIAPEMFDPSTAHDGLPTEVYSLGVVLYDMMFGAVTLDIVNDQVDPDVPLQCLELIDSMLDSCPDNRPTIEKILQHPWLQE